MTVTDDVYLKSTALIPCCWRSAATCYFKTLHISVQLWQ